MTSDGLQTWYTFTVWALVWSLRIETPKILGSPNIHVEYLIEKVNISSKMSRIFQPSMSISLPGVDNHDTERRRQIALKALSDRLNKAAGAPGSGGAGSNSGMLCECRYTFI